ncbi:MAG: diacylglyceryl transferase [Gammaproteobacteria bacterium]|nr:diacylglyceryl transferase [Gammaproteobacteria bacterium]|tara:strand:- start:4 stop:297 length:294 start_codon:yes stop_codon:yes gene_type:complete
MDKIRKFFKVTSNTQLLIVNIVFAITGSLALYFANIVTAALHINYDEVNIYAYWTVRILLIIPIYQLLLIVVGTALGQFTYFWNIEKRLLRRFGLKF